ncbi:MAG TPA: magnesium transporter [Candidatus Humimicrobiaceae bacterium]|nr:magnesium transporter [Candidatus Humimicrobiaceae bacterium]
MSNKYPPESAGRRMISNVPTAIPEEKILDIRKKLFEKAKDFETLNYIYIIDRRGKLVGVLSLKDAFQKPEESKIEDLMVKDLIKARPNTDQERVAILALKHNLKSIPVVDKEDIFLGVVTSDVILGILHSENIEDTLRFAGIYKHGAILNETLQFPISVLSKIRLPWLIFGLLGGLFAAQIVTFFEDSLRVHFVLAAFIPLIVYMADAVGVQAQTLFIRSLAFNPRLNAREYLLKEVKISFVIALILGFLLGLISFLWFGFLNIGIILGFSLFFTVICACLIAVLVPWLLQGLKKDPAIGSGPFATIVRDILTLVIYFSVASLILKLF